MHLLAFEALANSFTTLAAMANLASESSLTKDGATRYFVGPGLTRVKWATALGVTITRAKIITPSLSVARSDLEILPRRKGAVALSLGFPEVMFPQFPILVTPGEDIEVDIAQASGGAEDEYAFVELGPDADPPVPAGPVIVSRATATATLTAKGWTVVSLTLDSALPVGTYHLIGFVPISATAIAARVIIPGQLYRPGVPAFAGTESAAIDSAIWRNTEKLTYQMSAQPFTQQFIPQVEFFANAADTAETVYFFFVKVG